jgi:hypothetical protein
VRPIPCAPALFVSFAGLDACGYQTSAIMLNYGINGKQENVLFLSNSFELNCLVCVDPSAGGTTPIEVLLDVMPTKAADLKNRRGVRKCKMQDTKRRRNLPGTRKCMV